MYSALKKNIKTIYISSILLVSFFGGMSFAQETLGGEKILLSHTQDYSLYSYYDSGIVLLIPQHKGLQPIFKSNGISAQNLLPFHEGCAMINGFYFGKGVNGEKYQPAGPMTLYQGLRKQPKIIDSTTNPEDDTNLGVHIIYNSINNTVGFNTPLTISYGVSFFAGPMIVQDGNLNDQIYQKKSHRTTSHYRTFLIQTQDKKAVFGITTKKFSLADLGQKLQQIYNNQTISVVNLDGGSSTSLSATGYTFNTTKTLPIRFSTCKN